MNQPGCKVGEMGIGRCKKTWLELRSRDGINEAEIS